MEGHSGKTRYSSLCFLQNVMFCWINMFFSFPEYFKRILLFLLHWNEYHGSTFVYPSLQTVDIPSFCIIVFQQYLTSEPYDVHNHSCEPNETKANIIPFVFDISSSKIQERYKPPKFPSILHVFSLEHYKYLPKFGGEPNDLLTENHIQSFENFIDLF